MTIDDKSLLPGVGAGNQDPGQGQPDPKGGAGAGAGNPDPNSDPNKKPNGTPGEFDWHTLIPEDLKDRAEWANIKEAGDLFKNYINAQQTISKSVRIPDANTSPEDIVKFYEKLGKPASKEDYKLDYQKKDGYVYDASSFDMAMFQDLADKANLTVKQYEALAKAYIDVNNENYINYNKQLSEKAAQELKSAEAQLRSDWGTDYTTNINAISERVKKLYSENTIARMQNAGLFRDPEFLKTHLKLTKMMTGDTVFIEGNAVENVSQSLAELQQKRDKLMMEDYSKNHEEVMSLNKQIVSLQQAQAAGMRKV